MLQKLLEKEYGIVADEPIHLGPYEGVRGSGWIFLSAKTNNLEEEYLTELGQIAEHMRNYGDNHVPLFLQTKDEKLIAEWEKVNYCVLAIQSITRQEKMKYGRKLAKFHERGRRVPFAIERSSRIGQWKELWEKRLEQMEKVWNGLLFQNPTDEFERMFIESFPYYLGLTENAIQYLVDTEIDDEPTDADGGTVCHERFSYRSWGSDYYIKNPFDWVFDHRSRDLAEWTRERYFHNSQTYAPDLRRFFDEYQSIAPLSSFSWKLLYSRILFPLHYFECVERYYMTPSEQEKRQLEEQLNKMLKQSREYEQFLGGFYGMVGAPVRKLKLTIPEWLYTI